VGWAIGDGAEHFDEAEWDALEAEQLYSLLEQKVIPEFYCRNENNIPTAWLSRMRVSMAQLTPRFSADRTVREYTEQHYLRAANSFYERAANNGEKGSQLNAIIKSMQDNWDSIHFGEVNVNTVENQHRFEIQVFFNEVNPENVKVELYSDKINDEEKIVQVMDRGNQLEGESNAYWYFATVTAHRLASDFTARAMPFIPSVSVPLEISRITWQH